MRVRLVDECTQLKPSLLGIFVCRKRKGEDAYPSAEKTPQRLFLGLAGPSSTKDCLIWYGDRLLLRAGRRLLSAIEPDAEWPGMWRVRLPDGRLSDMANRTWAKDAARALALATRTLRTRGSMTQVRLEPSLLFATADHLRFQGND
jgi:hypothetical protein